MHCICGDTNCKGFCKEAIGSRLFKFLNEVRMIPLRTGDTDRDRSVGTIYVTGGQIIEDESISTIYKSDVVYPHEPKLAGVDGIDSRECLKMFLSMMDIGTETIDILDNIEKRRLVILPFKPKTNIKVKVHKTDSTGKSKLVEVPAKIKSIKWNINKVVSETDEGEGEGGTKEVEDDVWEYTHLIITDYIDVKSKIHAKVNVDEYNIRFSAENFEEKKPKDFNRKQVIKMNVHGYIYPICIQKDTYQVLIDGSHMYYRKSASDGNEGIIVIGEWNDERLDIDSSLVKKLGIEKEISAKLYSWVNYLKAYKSYIAPVGTAEMNIVNMNK